MIDRLPQTPIDTPGAAARGAFAHPQDVVDEPGLSTVEKRRILTEWAEDAKAHAREGKAGGANEDLSEIERALAAL